MNMDVWHSLSSFRAVLPVEDTQQRVTATEGTWSSKAMQDLVCRAYVSRADLYCKRQGTSLKVLFSDSPHTLSQDPAHSCFLEQSIWFKQH